MKKRIVEYYSPLCGTWWKVQVRFLGIWRTSTLVFHSKNAARQGLLLETSELFEQPTNKVLK